jgi:hypothetical protein
MTAMLELGPLATAAAGYRGALARLEDAAGDAEAAWRLLPAALDSPGTQIAVGRYIGPAHRLSTALVQAADALHSALSSSVLPVRRLEAQLAASPDDPALSARLAAAEAACAATIAAIRGGEAGSVDLPCPTPPTTVPSRPTFEAVSVVTPIAPPAAGLPGLGGAITGGAAAALGAASLLGVLGLVLSLGGSTDSVAGRPDNRKPRDGVDPVRVTPYTPCNPWDHGPGCQEWHLTAERPGDSAFTGDRVRGDEPPGEMPGTDSSWAREATRKGDGWRYLSPDGREMRVMKPGADDRYPNGYVAFTNKGGQRIDLYGKSHFRKTSDDVHITRNSDGSFPVPKGWNE